MNAVGTPFFPHLLQMISNDTVQCDLQWAVTEFYVRLEEELHSSFNIV